MKRKIFAIIFVLLIVLCILIFCRYIFLYNKGNSLYERRDYAGAIEYYEKALKANPSHLTQAECRTRVNLALSMVHSLGEDYADPQNVAESIETLQKAREILLDNKCAANSGDGHNKEAQTLKDEIDELIKQLQEQDEQETEEPQEPEDPSEENSENPIDSETEQSIQEQLKNYQDNSYQERNENIQFREELDGDMNWDLDSIIW